MKPGLARAGRFDICQYRMRKFPPPMTVAHMLVALSALSRSLSLRRLGIWLSVALGDPRSPPQLAASLWLCGPAGSLALTLATPELVLALSRSR